MIITLLVTAARYSGLYGPTYGISYVDFDAFHLVGRMVWGGALDQAYSIPGMLRAESADAGFATQLPWTYPPQFDLIVAPIALLNKGVAYLIMVGAAFALYVGIIRRLAGTRFSETVIVTSPAMAVCIIVGQNGFLTGALVGAFALATLRGRTVAGLPLGLMVIKPHLAVGLTVMALARRDRGVLAVAALVILASVAASTLAFGPGIWGAFIAGVHEAGAHLRQGTYPLYRMTSLYATARTLGLPANAAFALQATGALAACAVTAGSVLRRWPPQWQIGIALLCTLSISPYNYDYDLPIFGLAAALLAADLIARASRLELATMLGLAWLSSGWWIIVTLTQPLGHLDRNHTITVSGFAYALLIALTVAILRRAAAPAPLPLPEPLAQAA